MTEVRVGETPLLDCQKCDGLWIGAEAFERLCSSREAQAAVLHPAASEARFMEREVRYRPCLQCGTMMNRVNFAKVSGTVVDVCKNHGTFLDRGELQAIVQFIQGGGLERSRQRLIEDLKEQEQRVKDLQWRVTHTGKADPIGHADVFVSFGDLFSD